MNKGYVKYALLLAGCNALWMVIIYLLGFSHSLLGLLLMFLAIIFTVVFCVIAIKEERNAGGGYITLGKAFTTGFLTLFIAGIVGIGFNYIYTEFIDTGYMEYMTHELPVNIAQKFGAPDSEMDKIREKIEAEPIPGFDVWQIVKSLFGSAFMSAFFAIIIGAIMKRNKPIELVE